MGLKWSIQKRWEPRPLPPPTGRWAERLMTLRAVKCPPEEQLRRMEAEGATAQELADQVMEMYLPLFPRFLGLSQGFQQQKDLSPRDIEMNLWVLSTLRDGWRILEVFGTDPLDLLAWTLGHRSPSEWPGHLVALRVPTEFMAHLRPEGLEFLPQERPLDLRWLFQVAGAFRILGPVRQVLLAEKVVCRSEVVLRGVGGLTELRGWVASKLSVEECPDLATIALDPGAPLQVQACPMLKIIKGNLPPSLVIEDCPELELLDVVFPRSGPPIPSLIVRRCPKLQSIGRISPHAMECRDLILEDCPSLKNFWPKLTIRRERRIEGCPNLEVLP